ncbi:MAG: OsmC family protein [Burkholderiales bacterium]|nr:OsmC family protein [Burkholderiales bacterium]
MSETQSFRVTLESLEGYQFKIDFGDGFGTIQTDEPPPLGDGAGPNPARLVAAAVANCLAASLAFCIRKFKQDPGRISAEVVAEVARNERARLRIARLDVTLRLGTDAAAVQHLDRCLAQFEDFCIVTQSIRTGIPVGVSIVDAGGKPLAKPG